MGPFETFQNKFYIYDLRTAIGMLSLAEGGLLFYEEKHLFIYINLDDNIGEKSFVNGHYWVFRYLNLSLQAQA